MLFRTKNQHFELERRVLVMGILNVTPDSFSEEGLNYDAGAAVAAGLAMEAAGAEILDIGGESTRPGAEPVAESEELRRVIPVIEELHQRTDVALSIDTSKAGVARKALAGGAEIVNDISGLHHDPEMAGVVGESGAGCVLMHMRGTPQNMQQFTVYRDLFGEINDYFRDTIELALVAGVKEEQICLDPGIGFSKTAGQCLELINHLDLFAGHGRPLLLGPSRKSFIGKTLGLEDPKQRLWGTAAAVAAAILRGARIIRVHDVAEMRQVCDLALAIAAA